MMSSPDPPDSDLSFLDGFEQDLCPVGSDGGGTQILVEDSGKPTQLVHKGFFDMTVDDSCDEEVSGGVSRVRRANRRRFNSGGHGLPTGRPCGWKRHRSECDVDDPQSQDEDHPHSDESVASSKGASVVEERGCSDQDAEEDKLHTPSSTIFPGRGAITAGFESLDTVDLADIWKVRAILMQSVPKFLHGVYRFAMRQALDAVKKVGCREEGS